MAIYRVGSAAMSANGVITGTGTKWQTALSLVRVGSTIMFLRDELHLATISAIVSETEMRATDTDGVAVPDGDYAILLSDSLTVDGLAQDIAETLKYYQGQETEVGALVTKIEAYLKQASDSAAASEASNQASAASAAEAANQVGLAQDQVGLAQDQVGLAQDQVAAAKNQVAAAKNQADAAASRASDAATSASQADNSAQKATTKASEAAASQQAAASSAGAASTSATNAKTSETNAKSSADSAAATLASAVVKSQNLNDLANKSTAWANLLSARTAATARTDLGLGNSATRSVGSAAGTVAAGDDSRLNTIEGKSGGTLATGSAFSVLSSTFPNVTVGSYLSGSEIRTVLNGRGAGLDGRGSYFALNVGEQVGSSGYGLISYSGFGDIRYWNFYQNGNANASGSWINGSDERHKSDIENVKDALKSVLSWRGATYQKLDGDKEVGLIAQDVERNCPEAVINIGPRKFNNGFEIEDFKALNTPGVSAAYMVESMKDVVRILDLLLEDPEAAREKIKELKAIITE